LFDFVEIDGEICWEMLGFVGVVVGFVGVVVGFVGVVVGFGR
jgi:hypothetical protein